MEVSTSPWPYKGGPGPLLFPLALKPPEADDDWSIWSKHWQDFLPKIWYEIPWMCFSQLRDLHYICVYVNNILVSLVYSGHFIISENIFGLWVAAINRFNCMYLCMYVFMYVCMQHVCMHVCMYACTCMYVCLYVQCMYVCMYMYIKQVKYPLPVVV